jgi:hypothetical protein
VRSILCTKRREARGFLVEHQNKGRRFLLKTTGMVSPGLVSKPVMTVSLGLAVKLVVAGFPVWASKPAATVW